MATTPNLTPTTIDRVAQLASAYAGYSIASFAWPKLAADPGAVGGFQQIGGALGVDPTFFRLFVGSLEAASGVLLLTGLLLFFAPRALRFALGAGHLLLAGLMVGALFTELVVRPGEQPGLVQTALLLLAFAATGLAYWVPRFGLPALRSIRRPATA